VKMSPPDPRPKREIRRGKGKKRTGDFSVRGEPGEVTGSGGRKGGLPPGAVSEGRGSRSTGGGVWLFYTRKGGLKAVDQKKKKQGVVGEISRPNVEKGDDVPRLPPKKANAIVVRKGEDQGDGGKGGLA